MRVYYVFYINNYFSYVYRNKPYKLYKILEEMYHIKEYDMVLTYKYYEQIAIPFDKQSLNDYIYNRLYNDKTYYIIKVKKKKKSMYVVFNEKKKKIETYDGSFVKKSEVKTAFENKYGVASTKTEIGYENGEIAYCLTYKGNDTLIYAFYAIDDGEFIKAYRLEPDA